MAFQVSALKGYNNASDWQYDVLLKKFDLTFEHLKIASTIARGPIKIVDYGCSEGLNSMNFFSELLKNSEKFLTSA